MKQKNKTLGANLQEEFEKQKGELIKKHKEEIKKLKQKHEDESNEFKKTQEVKVKKFEEEMIATKRSVAYVYIIVGIGIGAVGFALISKSDTFQNLSETTQNYLVRKLPSIIQERLIPCLMK